MRGLKKMKDWKEELRQIKKEVREEIREQGRLWRGEIDDFKKYGKSRKRNGKEKGKR